MAKHTQSTLTEKAPVLGEPSFEELDKMTDPVNEVHDDTTEETPELSLEVLTDLEAFSGKASQSVGKEIQHNIGYAEVPAGEYSPGQTFQPSPFKNITSADDHIATAVAAVRTELLAEIEKLRVEMGIVPVVLQTGIAAPSRSTVYCPKCGLQLDGGSATGVKGMPYVHTFQGSPLLGGKSCEYRGRKFEAPIVFLKLMPEQAKKTA